DLPGDRHSRGAALPRPHPEHVGEAPSFELRTRRGLLRLRPLPPEQRTGPGLAVCPSRVHRRILLRTGLPALRGPDGRMSRPCRSGHDLAGGLPVIRMPAARPELDLTLLTALLVSYIWLWQGAFPGDFFVCATLYFAIGVWSHWRRKETAAEIGLRV